MYVLRSDLSSAADVEVRPGSFGGDASQAACGRAGRVRPAGPPNPRRRGPRDEEEPALAPSPSRGLTARTYRVPVVFESNIIPPRVPMLPRAIWAWTAQSELRKSRGPRANNQSRGRPPPTPAAHVPPRAWQRSGFSVVPTASEPGMVFPPRRRPPREAVCPQTPVNGQKTQLYCNMTAALLSHRIYRQ